MSSSNNIQDTSAAIAALREYYKNRTSIKTELDDTLVRFGAPINRNFDRNLKIEVKGAAKMYTVAALYYWIAQSSEQLSTYIKSAISNKVDFVGTADKALIENLILDKDVATTAAKSSAAPDARLEENKESLLQRLVKEEIIYFDRNTRSCTTTQIRGLKEVLDKAFASGKNKAGYQEDAKRRKTEGRTKQVGVGLPIIIVPPNAANSTVNIHNVKDLLENEKYNLFTAEKIAEMERPTYQVVYRRHPTCGMIEYKVYDNPHLLTSDMWEQVVAVFVNGEAWQLENWKWDSAAKIFNRVKGLYLYFDDDAIPDQVKRWNVQTFKIKRGSRNRDSIAASAMWNEIDKHMDAKFEPMVRALIENLRAKEAAEKHARLAALKVEDEMEHDSDDGDNV